MAGFSPTWGAFTMKVHELQNLINRQGLSPLYLVIGEEPYFRDQALSILRAAGQETDASKLSDHSTTNDSSQMFHVDVVYGDETDASEILAISEETSFFSLRRLLIIKWADKLSARDGEALMPYFQAPNETTTLVITAAKLDGRTKWVQDLKKRATVVECAPVFEGQRAGWVTQRARELGLQLEDSALEILKDQIAEGLYGTAGELEKLVAFMPEGHRVSATDVETVRGKPPGISVFDWSEAVARGDQGRALDIVAKNLETGEAPLRMLGAFLWQMRKIWKTHALMQEGHDAGQAARQAGVPPFRAREFVQQVQRWSEPLLRRAWELFAQADSALKGGRASRPKLILDDLVIQLCQATKAGQGNKVLAGRTKPHKV
ncbi:MAG: DNA polymerase III subunit delta [Nitrospirales bacterium]|nr:MAG: DNA polymerase III subunit delta [Nitrospirales bacterium]